MIASEPPRKGAILAALRRSPLVGGDLNLTRSRGMGSAFESRRIWWIVITVAAVCAVIAVAALNIAYFMDGFGACKTVVRSSIPSPDGTKSIVIFGKECGATVGFNTQASIAPIDGSFSFEQSPAFFVASGGHVIMAKWLGNSTVEISSIPERETVFKSEQRVGDIEITYK
jgi:hypothetical protein